MIAIVDYGMGNLRSVEKALEYCGIPCTISSDPEEIMKSGGLIIPGVGAFRDAMENLTQRGLEEVIKSFAGTGKPVLGVCLGMQLLFEESEEMGRCGGIGLLKGVIKRIGGEVKVPHMGWNTLNFEGESRILSGVEEGSYAYFVHSYYADIGEEGILKAWSTYGKPLPSVVEKGNLFGMQFHPEKSSEVGIKMLRNFGELVL